MFAKQDARKWLRSGSVRSLAPGILTVTHSGSFSCRFERKLPPFGHEQFEEGSYHDPIDEALLSLRSLLIRRSRTRTCALLGRNEKS